MTQHSNSMNSVYDSFPTTYTFHNILHLYDEMSSQFDELTAPTTHMNIACQTNIANSIYDVHYLKTVCTVTVFNGGGWKNHSAPFLPRPHPVPCTILLSLKSLTKHIVHMFVHKKTPKIQRHRY